MIQHLHSLLLWDVQRFEEKGHLKVIMSPLCENTGKLILPQGHLPLIVIVEWQYLVLTFCIVVSNLISHNIENYVCCMKLIC